MSLLFLDSFDHYSVPSEKWDASFLGGNIIPIQSQGRFVPGALQIKGSGGGGNRTKSFQNTTEVIAGFAWNNLNADQYDGLFSFVDDGNNEHELTIDTDTGIATLTSNGNTAATPAATFTGSAWQHVEMRVKLSDTVGELEIRRNGVQVALETGLDTKPTGATGFAAFRVTADNNLQNHYMDDLYILNTEGTTNNTFVGDSRITVLRPKANGAINNFTPVGAASNFQAVDEDIHDQDTSYVEAGTVGAREAYDNKAFSDVGISPGTIYGVQTVNAVKKTDAGQLNYKDQMVVAGVGYDNGTEVVSTSGDYQMTFMVRDTDPSDNGAWTEAKIAAVGSGIEITLREEA